MARTACARLLQLLVVVCLIVSAAGAGASARKIAIIAGAPSHGASIHGWDKGAEFLRQCLLRATNIEPVEIDVHHNGWPQDSTALDSADAIVFLADGRELHPLREPGRAAKIRELAKRGVGLAFIHYCVDPPEGLQQDMLNWIGGCYQVGLSQNPVNTVKVTPIQNGHPISRGCGGYVAEDEWYFDIGFRPNDPNVVPLLTGPLPPREPQDKVLAWAYTRPDGGRGFGFTGGHTDKNWHMEPFRKLVLNAILWIAKAEVPQGGVSSMQPWRFVSIPNFTGADLTYPQSGWEETLDYVLNAIKAENPEFVLVPGDLVMGNWPDKDSIEKQAAVYYPAWIKRMQDHRLTFYAAIGDHDIGGGPWPGDKADLVRLFKRQFQKHLKMPLNGPLRMKGTAYWFIHENALFIALDVFEKGDQAAVTVQVAGEQLQWLERILADNSGVEHIVVMGHTPVMPLAADLGNGDRSSTGILPVSITGVSPVEGTAPKQGQDGPATHGQDAHATTNQALTAPLTLAGGTASPLWQTLKKHRADLYLCNRTGAIRCTQADGILQIAHGGSVSHGSTLNYLLVTVSPRAIELEMKEIAVANDGGRVIIADDARKQGFVTVGRGRLSVEGAGTVLKDATGSLASASVKEARP